MIGPARNAAGRQEPAQPAGLLLALARERTGLVGAGPRLRIAGVGVAQEIELRRAAVGRAVMHGLSRPDPFDRRSRRASPTNGLIRVAIIVSVLSKAARRCASVPSTFAGSS